MRKLKVYDGIRLDSAAFSQINASMPPKPQSLVSHDDLSVTTENGEWTFDSIHEFLAAADQGDSSYSAKSGDRYVRIFQMNRQARVTVTGATRADIEEMFSIIEEHIERCSLPEPETTEDEERPRVFIGHGRDPQWRALKDHLQDQHGYEVIHYEIGSRAGHSIRDILEEMLAQASIAFLVMTGEDETKDGEKRARQNVVHEAGLFQGKLGFSRGIIVTEDETEDFSNLDGVQKIVFPKGRIRESFGDVLATLRREFGGS